MDGGKLLGQGAYGCAFYPHLPCKGTKSYPGSIGKIFSRASDLKEEEEINKTILLIDPESKFTVPLNGTCMINPEKLNSENTSSECNKFKKNGQKQLMYRYGGVDMDKFARTFTIGKKAMYIDDIFPLLLPIIEGITAMCSLGKAHSDIKPENLVYDFNRHLMYLIDFGLLTDFNDIQHSDHLLKHPYLYYPPEFLVKYYQRTGKLIPSTDFLKRFTPNFTSFINYLRKYSLENEVSMFMSKYLEMNNPRNFTDFFQSTCIPTIDTYSLAVSMFEIMYILYKDRKLNVRDHKLYDQYVDVLAKMSHPNPLKRMDSKKSAERFRKIMKKGQNDTLTNLPKTNKLCMQMLGKEIKLKLQEKGLSKYGTKEQMCKRLEGAQASTTVVSGTCVSLRAKEIKIKLKENGLPQYGTKADMCKRLKAAGINI